MAREQLVGVKVSNAEMAVLKFAAGIRAMSVAGLLRAEGMRAAREAITAGERTEPDPASEAAPAGGTTTT